MIISFILLSINGAQGYLNFKIYNATHIQFAFISTIFYMFTESWIMFYFIGSGKTIKETIISYKLNKKIYDDVLESKRKLFPHITMNVLLIGTVFVIGGGVHTKAISAMTHGVLFFGGLIHFIYVIYLQHYYFKDTARILIDLGQQIKEN
jgi:hypothetical protein|tara:strand:+ start:111 stop:560 length:450 start_codon:yes stop_codon:yes gene_type:complete